MTMIDTVARAILKAHDITYGGAGGGGFDDLPPAWQECFRGMARAAIAAMREPTTGMVEAVEAHDTARGLDPTDWEIAWPIAIDAALTEK